MTLAALGIVYGDIGTSPLYALRECFNPAIGLSSTIPNIFGILSLIVWALLLVVTLKYLLVVMRADNDGQGGILALMALAQRSKPLPGIPQRLTVPIALGLVGAAFVYGDGMITPAISVLSAVEGVAITTPVLAPYLVFTTVIILGGLFVVQGRGTGWIGHVFGPIMLVWFLAIGVLGPVSIVQSPQILQAMNPVFGLRLLVAHPGQGFLVLGSVFLVLTGAEALYADMGHLGKGPIRLGWYVVVLPSLLLQYFGQGALLLRQPDAITNPFYLLAPSWGIFPLVGLATAATVIASQALLSGAVSLTQQAIHLGYLPRMAIRHTSPAEIGQIYIPFLNWSLFVGTVSLVLHFGSSSHLAAAYGIAVSGTMVMTTLLIYVVARQRWNWSVTGAVLLTGLFLFIDLVFLSANALKISQGGWLPLAVGMVLLTLMTTWHEGRALVGRCFWGAMPPLVPFLKEVLAADPVRVPGHAVFMTQSPELTPPAFAQNVRHNKVVHEHVLFLTVMTERTPFVPQHQQIQIELLEPGIHRLTLQHGFMQMPDIPAMVSLCRLQGLVIPVESTTFFLSRINSLATPKPGMALWREHLFVFLARNSRLASSFFRIPSEQVVEIGVVVDI
ncbi:MAG: potassium transporter Kup [Nitrospira sp.]|nr:potassium transporter Kup [Nitrospira sp.]